MNDNNAIWGNTLETGLNKDELKNKVTSVNGKTGAVKLTAEDVKALSQDKLNEGVNEALRRAKESGEFDGDDYVITEADYNAIAEIAVGLIPIYNGEVEDV